MHPRTLIHIEDDLLWSALVAKAAAATDGMIYGGRAATCAQGLELAKKTKPSLVVLDLLLPDGSGLDLPLFLSKIEPAPKVLLLTVRTDDATLFHLGKPYVHGLLWKNTHLIHTLQEAIAHVLSGNKFLPHEVKQAMQGFRADSGAFFKIISDREFDLLNLIGRGYTDDEIADLKKIACPTVQSHRKHIMQKLGVHKREQLIRWCIQKGFF